MAYFKYRQVADKLLELIHNGTYLVGDKIPKEDELCEQFGVGRQTIRSAVSCLEEEGILKRVQGSGTYVCEKEKQQEETDAGPAPVGNPGTIALVMMNSQNYIFISIMQGVCDYLLEKGYLLNTIITDGDYEKERMALESLLRNPPAGILLEPVCSGIQSVNEPLYKEIAAKIPCLLLHMDETKLMRAVPLGDRQGVRKATDHLISLGHRKIGAILGFAEITGQNRFAGYMESLREHGISFADAHCLWVDFSKKDEIFSPEGKYALDRFLEQVTAVICHDDRMAYKLVGYLKEKGMRVPDDISVVGYDNSDYSVEDLPLTTVTHPKTDYGRNAAAALLELIRDPAHARPERYAIDAELVVRESTAKPAQA
ncbi:MAG: GntR family transcriptional regulator [Eubacterium sp.]|nr:GntR family transcriptional regulator [Eubacterium sp.]